MKTIILAFLCCILTVASPAFANTAATSAVPYSGAVQETFVHNPVFDGDTYIFEMGQNHQESIFLIHGIGDEASTIWRALATDLSRDYHVVACDLPGFGRSEKTASLYSPERYADFIDWLIDKYSTKKVVLLGHSLGGTLALNYASVHPEKVKHLVLVDAAGILHRIALAKNFLKVNWPDPGQGLFTRYAARLFRKPISLWNRVTGSTIENLEFTASDASLELLMAHDKSREIFLGGNPTAIAALALVQENFTEKMTDATMPTSLIWGRQDEVAPLRTGILLQGKLPNSRLRIIDHVGHVPILEQPEQFLNILREELSSPPINSLKAHRSQDNQGIGICQNQPDMVFSGNFDSIEITGCRGTVLQDVQANQLNISGSEVMIKNTTVRNQKTALILHDSIVVATNVILEGDVAIQSSDSRLDLAGAELICKTAAIATNNKTLVLFSVSTISKPQGKSIQHGVVRIQADRPL